LVLWDTADVDTEPDRLGEILRPADRSAPAYPIAAVDNTLRILLLLRDRGRLSLAEVASELGVVRSSAHRLMAMLSYYDFVRQDPVDRTFRPGKALVDIGLSAARSLDIRSLARPVLTDLAESTGMTAQLVLPRGRNVLFVDGVESRRSIRAALRTGNALPAHVAAAGKALLATLTDDQLRGLYKDVPPERVTDRSLTSVTSLLREMKRVRRDGYAINRGESEIGVLAMGIAVVTVEPDAQVGLSVAGPDSAEVEGWEARLAASLRQAAAELSETVTKYYC
jgi:DNA-binding IclR family transcriptional regulator